jgi:hypothetical protein
VGLCVQEEPLGCPAAAEDVSERPAFHVVAGREMSGFTVGARFRFNLTRIRPLRGSLRLPTRAVRSASHGRVWLALPTKVAGRSFEVAASVGAL